MPENKGLRAVLRGAGLEGRPALVLMHFLGGSLREWDEVVELLGSDLKTLALDLPGFGESSGVTGYSVNEMADAVQAAIQAADLSRYVLVGHSMGGKVAAVIARRLEDAASKALVGLVLVAGSPPGPEPMDDARRDELLALLAGEPEQEADRARSYISKNDLRDIPQSVEDRSVAEMLRMNRAAWTAWLTQGSREDWSERVGLLALPALVIAGEKDAALGPDGQRRETMPHLGDGRLVVFAECSHLIPLEQPQALADVLRAFVATVSGGGSASVFEEYSAFLKSSRVSPRTREILEARMAGPGRSNRVLNEAQQKTLRAVLARVLPQSEANAIDLAGYVTARLGSGENDGWRYAVLPEDVSAYRLMLDRLGKAGFAQAGAEVQDRMLGALGAEAGSAEARWFEDLRVDAAEAWASHPRTMAWVGFSGPGVGGAHTTAQGFDELGAGRSEPWEPEVLADRAGVPR